MSVLLNKAKRKANKAVDDVVDSNEDVCDDGNYGGGEVPNYIDGVQDDAEQIQGISTFNTYDNSILKVTLYTSYWNDSLQLIIHLFTL
jgi:hypothetical protein